MTLSLVRPTRTAVAHVPRPRGPGTDLRCFWMAHRVPRIWLEVRPVVPRMDLDGSVRPVLRVVGEDEFELWVGTLQVPARIVRTSKGWHIAAGTFRRKLDMVAELLVDKVWVGSKDRDIPRERAQRWAKQGWIPGDIKRPFFVGLCWNGATSDRDECFCCEHLGLIRQSRKLRRWTR